MHYNRENNIGHQKPTNHLGLIYRIRSSKIFICHLVGHAFYLKLHKYLVDV